MTELITIDVTQPPPVTVEAALGVVAEVVVSIPGPQGPAGGGTPWEYQMPTAQASAAIDHPLGYDPVSIQVFDESGVLCDGYSVSFPIPGSRVLIGFDVSIAALIRLK